MSRTIGSAALERDLIASVLVDPERFALLEGVIRPEDFLSPANAVLWETFATLTRRKLPIETATLRAELVRTGKLDLVGGDEAILADSLGTIYPEKVAAEIAALALRRRVTTTALELAAEGQDVAVETEAFLEGAEKKLADALAHADLGDGPQPIRVGAVEVYERIERISKAGRAGVTGLRTGIARLDSMLTGLHPGELVVVAGRPGMGKSSFGRLPARIAAESGELAAIFSLEMPREQVAAAMIAAEADLDLRRMRAAQLDGGSWQRCAVATGRISDLPIVIDETPAISLAQLRSRCRRLRVRHGKIGVIVIDYLQLMRGSNPKDSREQQISEISRGLKALAKELQCPVIALSQLNRACEQRPGKRPQLSDLRESGAIEQDADAVLLLFRRGYYAEQAAKETRETGKRASMDDIAPGVDDGIAEIIVAKQRNGPTGSVTCRFLAASAHFRDDEPEHTWSYADA